MPDSNDRGVSQLVRDPWIVGAFSVGVLSTLLSRRLYKFSFRRIQNSDWVSAKNFEDKRFIRGQVTSVGDADNFRLYHTPGFGWRLPFKFRRIPTNAKDLKDQTIHIRIAGVDAPELAHFGREAQPYSAEALQWLKDTVLGRIVWCQLISRDQYGRTVAVVYRSPIPFLSSFLFLSTRCVSLEMLKSGYATVYEGMGAYHEPYGKSKFLDIEATARNARRGMWASKVVLETPMEYKKRHTASAGKGTSSESGQVIAPRSIWRRLWPF